MAAASAAQTRPFPLHTGIATVTAVARITPQMARITLGGDAVAGYPDEEPGEILTLIWPAEGAAEPVLPLKGTWRFPPEAPEQHARNYTIRAYDPDGVGGAALTIDVVLHGDGAIASRWGGSVRPGDRIGVAGPRTHFTTDADADYTLLVGDETALPSIAATLERLPAGHRALAYIEVADADERQDLEPRCDAEVTWIHRDGDPAGRSPKLLETLRAAALPDGRAKVWVAGESLAVRALREHLRDERGLPIGPMQAIGYWKHRTTPDDVDADES